MYNIYVEPEESWEYFCDYIRPSPLVGSGELIAEDDEFDTYIEMSKDSENRPVFTAYMEGTEIYSEYALGESDCTNVCKMMYENFFESYIQEFDFSKMENDDDPVEEFDKDLIILKSEESINSCVEEFLDNVCMDDRISDEVIEDVKDHFLEYLARKHNLKIHRPMILETEDGEEFYSAFPYKQMIFDDEDNPIYK